MPTGPLQFSGAAPVSREGRRSGLLGALDGLDRRDVELELDLVRDEHAAGLERGVPAEPPLLAVQGGCTLEADAGVAERVLGRAGELERDGDRVGDALDG